MFYPDLEAYLDEVAAETDLIDQDRQQTLDCLAKEIGKLAESKRPIQLLFICTHNSRRSHFGQIWAAVAAISYGIGQTTTFSGGTEVTAFHANAVAAIKRCGIGVNQTSTGDNPRYRLRLSEDHALPPIYSKRFDAADNPAGNYIAIFSCNHADKACPVVAGADFRLALPQADPKNADGSPTEMAAYDQCCRAIAREMMYTFDRARTAR